MMTYESGDSYDGDWIDDNYEGVGTFRWDDGRVYVGEWKNDKQHGTSNFWSDFLGQGKMTYPNLDSYNGDWIEGKIEGFGIYSWIWPDARVYVGKFKNGKRHGTSNSSLNFQEWEGCIL